MFPFLTEICAAVKLIGSMRLLRSLVSVILAPDETVVIAIGDSESELQKHGHHNAAPAHEGPSGGILWLEHSCLRDVVSRPAPCTEGRQPA